MAAPGLAVLAALLAVSCADLTPIHRSGYCAFYGSCGRNPELNSSLLPTAVPCVSNSPARVATAAVLSLLRSVCPELVRGDNSTLVCCSAAQLAALRSSVALSGAVLARCPSCARNFANVHCHNICSPDQSVFVNVTRAAAVEALGQRAVLEYHSFYGSDYADAAFQSCAGVRLPATGGFALDTMCGRYGARLCTAQRWLDFQGDTSNGLAPLRIRFHLLPDGAEPGGGMRALRGTAWPCDGAPGEEPQPPCSCQDCAASCPRIAAPPAPPPPFRLGSADGALVVCVLLFAFFALLFLAAIAWGARKRRRKRRRGGIADGGVADTVITNADVAADPTKIDPVTDGSADPTRGTDPTKGTDPTRGPEPPPSPPPPPSGRGCTARFSTRSLHVMAVAFSLWGRAVASRPIAVLGVAVVAAVGLSVGLLRLQLTTDPVELWSDPSSRARQEKAFYDEHFGPFLRTSQVIVTARGAAAPRPYHSAVLGTKNFSAVLNIEALRALLELQEELAAVHAWVEEEQRAVTLKDVCYAPLHARDPAAEDCCVNSPTQYFQNNRTQLHAVAWDGDGNSADWRDHIMYCTNSPLSFMDITALEMSCMAAYGGPVFPYIAFGGYPDAEFTEAEALIVTYSLNNFPAGDARRRWVLRWEEQFLAVLRRFQSAHSQNLSVSFMAERSLEDELSRTVVEDIPVFAVSYVVVFAYIAIALGEYTAWRRVLVEWKPLLALCGVAVAVGAVLAAMGLLALLGVPSSPIVLEVLPFLVLAVGADNVFILVQEYQQQSPREEGETREQHVGRVLGRVAPGMVLCSASEVFCFAMGSLSSMPAVRTFAITAAVAIAIDFVLQMSAFVAVLALDARRQEGGRYDLCCCCGAAPRGHPGPGLRVLRPFMQRYYVPLLLHRRVRPLVVLLFLLLSFAALYSALHVEVGLDQELAMPTDSYVLHFLSDSALLRVGVPAFFVTTAGFDFSTRSGTDAVCSSAGCDPASLTQRIEHATRFPNVSYLAIPATSWVDDFLDWLNPTGRCCRVHRYGELSGEFCPSSSDAPSCVMGQCLNASRRPTEDEFRRFLPWFLNDRPTLHCAKGGLGAYDTAVIMDENGTIVASRFMAYQRPLRTSQEYTAALVAARALAENITAAMRAVPGTDPRFRVFPYAATYVYYEQYVTVVGEGLLSAALCVLPTMAASLLLLGMELRCSAAAALCTAMVLLDTVGLMAVWGVPYNAVALVNLVAAVGISVEFVSHVTCAFVQSTRPTRVERAAEATVNMGSKVLSGVALTNLPAVAVLAFAESQLIQLFFFRLNLIITALGALHGLVLLPVLLSYVGAPRPTALRSTDGPKAEMEQRAEKCSTGNGGDGSAL